jgi:hypothetical protein
MNPIRKSTFQYNIRRCQSQSSTTREKFQHRKQTSTKKGWLSRIVAIREKRPKNGRSVNYQKMSAAGGK